MLTDRFDVWFPVEYMHSSGATAPCEPEVRIPALGDAALRTGARCKWRSTGAAYRDAPTSRYWAIATELVGAEVQALHTLTGPLYIELTIPGLVTLWMRAARWGVELDMDASGMDASGVARFEAEFVGPEVPSPSSARRS